MSSPSSRRRRELNRDPIAPLIINERQPLKGFRALRLSSVRKDILVDSYVNLVAFPAVAVQQFHLFQVFIALPRKTSRATISTISTISSRLPVSRRAKPAPREHAHVSTAGRGEEKGVGGARLKLR